VLPAELEHDPHQVIGAVGEKVVTGVEVGHRPVRVAAQGFGDAGEGGVREPVGPHHGDIALAPIVLCAPVSRDLYLVTPPLLPPAVRLFQGEADRSAELDGAADRAEALVRDLRGLGQERAGLVAVLAVGEDEGEGDVDVG
jgi:hypothetical protein